MVKNRVRIFWSLWPVRKVLIRLHRLLAVKQVITEFGKGRDLEFESMFLETDGFIVPAYVWIALSRETLARYKCLCLF